MAYVLKKEELARFIEYIISRFRVVAPVMDTKDNFSRFTVLKKGEASSMVFDQPLYPAKDFFIPIKENIYDFSKESLKAPELKEKKTVFFMGRCDVNAVHRNDLIMLSEPVDPYYRAKRESAILIETPCHSSKACTCINMGLIDCYDLKIVDDEQTGNYMVIVGDQKGEDLMKGFGTLPQVDYKIKNQYEFKGKDVKEENKEVWERYGKECLSCSACTVVCPTCLCFTIDGHLNVDCKSGHNYRRWASCQLQEFTKVAGGYVFRKERGARGKQRIHCKFIYFKEKFGHPRCVGCGRCNSACPVGINIYHYYEDLK